jgi:hypothetical protein
MSLEGANHVIFQGFILLQSRRDYTPRLKEPVHGRNSNRELPKCVILPQSRTWADIRSAFVNIYVTFKTSWEPFRIRDISSRTEYPPVQILSFPALRLCGPSCALRNLRVGRFMSRKVRRINMTLRRAIEHSYEIRPSNEVVKRVWKEATYIIRPSLTAKSTIMANSR